MSERRFKAKLKAHGPGGAWTSLPIPFDVDKVFGTKARVAVHGTMNGFSFRTSLLPNGDGTHDMPVNKEMQKGAQAGAEDTVTVVMKLDDQPRTVAVPDDLQAALQKNAKAEKAFAAHPYSKRKEFADWITEAKKPETRARRVEKAVELLVAGKTPKG
jgi:hypothetical protein